MPMNLNHPAARKLFATDLEESIYQNSFFYKNKFIMPGSDNSVLVEMNDLATPQKGGGQASGYEVQFDLDGTVYGTATPGDNVIKGKEQKLSLFTDRIQINQFRWSLKDEGSFSNQLVPYGWRERAMRRLTDYWTVWYDENILVKLSGTLGNASTFKTLDAAKPTASARDIEGSIAADGNDLRAYAASRVVYGATSTTAGGMANTDKLTLEILDRAILKAIGDQSYDRLIPSLKIGGRDAYVFLMSYSMAKDLWQNASGRWYDIEKAKLQGGKDSDLISGSIGVYKSPIGIDVILYSVPRLVRFGAGGGYGADTNLKVERGLLLGKGAGRIAKGRESKSAPNFDIREEQDDRGNQLVLTSGIVTGIQRTAYTTTETGSTREDWASLAVDCYSNY